jgi:type I restriction enzyme R subunit
VHPPILQLPAVTDHGNADQLKENEPKRLALYKMTAALIRAYADIANELEEAGYSQAEIKMIQEETRHFEGVRDEVKKHSGDAVDLKMYEPAMRRLIDAYIRADESEIISAFDEMSLVQLLGWVRICPWMDQVSDAAALSISPAAWK